MSRLIWIFVRRTCHFVRLVALRLNYSPGEMKTYLRIRVTHDHPGQLQADQDILLRTLNLGKYWIQISCYGLSSPRPDPQETWLFGEFSLLCERRLSVIAVRLIYAPTFGPLWRANREGFRFKDQWFSSATSGRIFLKETLAVSQQYNVKSHINQEWARLWSDSINKHRKLVAHA